MKTNHIIAVSIFSLLTIVPFSGVALTSSHVSADTEVIDEVSLTVPVACTMGGVGTDSHNATLNPGTYSGASGSEYESGIGKTTLTVFCNDNNGFSVYAIGYTNDLYEGELHTKLVGQNTNQTIETKAYESGDTSSNWSMKIAKVDNPVSGDPITYNPQNMNVVGSFNTWQAIPDAYTKVAEYHSTTTDPSTTDTTLGAKLETTYATYIASTQPADTYTGQVKYTMVHPYNHVDPEPPSFKILYTGRALSSEPGQENPVTVRMYDLPESGKYNFLGTADGLYDKLTPGTLYGGFFKYNGDFNDFANFLQNYQTYDGTNYDFDALSGGAVILSNGASYTPEQGTVYLVKEVPELNYLTNYFHYTFGGTDGSMGLGDWWFVTTMDDKYYIEAGFNLTDVTNGNGDAQTRVGKKARSLKITTPGGDDIITPSVANPLATGANNVLAYWRDKNQEFQIENHIAEVTYYWITPDRYKVTGAHKRKIWFHDLTKSNLEYVNSIITPTITYVGT